MLNYVPSIQEYSSFSPKKLDINARHRFTLFTIFLSAVIIMNVLDGLLTVLWITTNKAVELNPLMHYLLGFHPVLFMSIKIALVYLGSFILLRYWENTLALISLVIAFCSYWIVLSYHCTMLVTLGSHLI